MGSTYGCEVDFLSRRTQMTYVVTDLEPGKKIEWTGTSSRVRAHDTIELDEVTPVTRR